MRQNCKIARGARAARELGKRPVTALRRFARLAGSEHGTSAVEFALAAPVLLALLVPLADFGIAFSEQLQVQQAAQAGAHYAALHPWNSNSATTIANAVTSANNLPGLSATPAPSQSCGCPNGSAITSATCGSTCSNGNGGSAGIAGYYVTVSAQATYRPQLPYSMLGSSLTLSATSTVRTQ